MPARIKQAEALFDQIKADSADHVVRAELHRLLHSLKGTGRSFGFSELGEAAGQCEALTSLLLDMPAQLPPADWKKRFSSDLGKLAKEASTLCSLEDSCAGNESAVFTLPAIIDEEGGGRLVYICDDELLSLERLAVQLACFGYQIETFSETQALQVAVLARRPDAVIMDIHFPQGYSAGTEMLAALNQEIGQVLPAIFLSARDDFAARLGAVQAGGQAYFHKPVRAIDLPCTLR